MKGQFFVILKNPNPRILVVDDNESIHNDFAKVLATTHQVDHSINNLELALFGELPPANRATTTMDFVLDFAFQGEDAVELLRKRMADEEEYAVAFVDMRMPPGWDGVTTIEELWKVDPTLNIVICTAYSDYSWQEIVERLGVSDRLLILKKPFDKVEIMQLAMTLTEKKHQTSVASCKLDELQHLIAQRTASLELEIHERRAMEEELIRARNVLEHLASHDSVTDLWNRRAILSILEQSLKLNGDARRPTSLLFIDVDHFKTINDRYGHLVGDAVLAEIGTRLKSVLREYDDVGRYGGEEFLIVLPACDRDIAPSIGNRVREIVQCDNIIIGDSTIPATISVGVVTNPRDGKLSAMAMIDLADKAMYDAKNAGRNCITIANEHRSSAENPAPSENPEANEVNV